VALSLTRSTPDVLVVLDRSASMGAGWTSVTTVLGDLMSRTEGRINWGLQYFSNDGACGAVGPPQILPAPNNAAAIVASMAASRQGGDTPLRFAVQAATTYLGTLDDGNAKYIVLATDGAANCCTNAGGVPCPPAPAEAASESSPDDVANAVAAVAGTYGGGAGIPVFVLGVEGASAATSALNSLAIAGGESQSPDVLGRWYYATDAPAAFESTVMTIPGMVRPCTFTLPSVPPDPLYIAVLFDNSKLIPRDATNGWSRSGPRPRHGGVVEKLPAPSP
jgi:hypothetical protein